MASETTNSWTVAGNQSIFDIALQLYGKADSAIQLLQDNNLNIDDELVVGTQLNYILQNTTVPKKYRVAQYVVATWEGYGSASPPNIELLDLSGYELRDDSGLELRDG